MSNQLQNARPTPAPSVPDSEKVNVLLVDDHPENLITLEVVLQSLGQNLVTVQSGVAALKYLLHHDVAVILLDVQMPGMDGFETARLIRQRDRSRHTPIIFLTALTESEELRSQGYTLGAVDYLYKPIEPTILTSKVLVFIELFKQNLEIQQQAAQLIAQNIEIIRAQAARQQAEEANRLKDEFLAIVSHELRTPLNSMLGWSQLLLKHKFDPDMLQRALETIHRNAETQAKLIEDILDISRLMRDKVKLSIRSFNLASFIHTTIESVRPQAETKSINLMVQIEPTILEIQADLVRLRQIFWNLLTNAIKFTPEGGQVSVQVSSTGTNFIELRVSDTGIGIQPEFLPHIFDHFRQADSSVTRAHGGLGLGLAIVRQLVELHNGRIHVYSDGCNQGTTVAVHLPVINRYLEGVANSSDIAITIMGEKCFSLDNLQILVVEDDTDNREFIEQILQEAGATVIAACCSQDAIAILKHTQPDVIVSDIAMPGEDGYQFIQQVRSSQHKDIPAIALTAYARSEDQHEALSTGFQMHFSKPINVQELISAIAQVVEHD